MDAALQEIAMHNFYHVNGKLGCHVNILCSGQQCLRVAMVVAWLGVHIYDVLQQSVCSFFYQNDG